MARSLTRAGAALFAVLSSTVVHAQSGYQQPPAPIAQILDAERTPLLNLSPDRSTMLLVEYHAMPSIADLAAPEARLDVQ